jgi:anti-sigma factor RsiW
LNPDGRDPGEARQGKIVMRARRCGGDAAAYALGALEPAEAEAFERHVAECERCAEDLGRFAHVVDALAMSTPQYPVPSRLRRRVMRSARGAPVAPVSRIWFGRMALATNGPPDNGLSAATILAEVKKTGLIK